MPNKVILLFLKCVLFVFHPFFVSMTEVEYKPQEKELEVSVRIFTDDLENTIKAQHPNQPLDILHPKDPKQTNAWIFDYIRHRLLITVNGQNRPLNYVGYEQQGESIWVYLEVKNVPLPKRIHFFNSLLYDYKKEQINMIRFLHGKQEKSTKLQYPDNTADFSF